MNVISMIKDGTNKHTFPSYVLGAHNITLSLRYLFSVPGEVIKVALCCSVLSIMYTALIVAYGSNNYRSDSFIILRIMTFEQKASKTTNKP